MSRDGVTVQPDPTNKLVVGDHFRLNGEPDDRYRVVTDIVDDVVFFVIHTPYGDEPEEGWVHAESVTPDKVVRLNS